MTTRALRATLFLTLATLPAAAQAPVYDNRGVAGDHFGASIATVGDVNGDGLDDYAVGSPHRTGGAVDSGAVTIYSAKDSTVIRTFNGWWTGDLFGWSVAGLGDIDFDGVGDLIVGAPGHGPGGGIFVYSMATGAQLHHVAQFLVPGSGMGWAVAGPGDMNWDGVPDFAFSEPFDGEGYVHVYSGFLGTAHAFWSGESVGDEFGYSLDAAGDVNGDGAGDLVVGAPGFDASISKQNCGKAYVHSPAAASPLYTFTRAVAGEELGHDVAGGEDINGDLVPDIAIGAPLSSDIWSEAGRVDMVSGAAPYVFLYSVRGEVAGDHFGTAVDLVPDLDGNGRGDIVVGAPDKDAYGIVDSGMAYVLSGTTAATLFTQNGYFPGDGMGAAVSSGGFFNADAMGDVLIGAPTADHPSLGADSGWARSLLGASPYPSAYCIAKVNSAGCSPSMGFAGCASQSVSDYFVVLGSNVLPNKPGMLIWSYQPKSSPFFGGTLCVQAPITRTPIQTAAQVGPDPCDGQYLFSFDHAYMASKNVPVGATVHMQYWSRDPGFAPPNAIGLTNGMAVPILP
jgi:hypothetical protein